MRKNIRFVLSICFALLAPLALATPPQTINYQGYLTNAGGTPVNSTVGMTFKFYNAASAGALLHTESQPSVIVTNGNFNVLLGSPTPIPLPFDVPYWLTVTITGDPEMSPRQPLASSPYAFRAAALDSTATITGLQVSGTITSATLPAGNLTGTIGTTQIANNAVTQAKLSPLTGAAAGKVLGTDGSNLQWQTAGTGTVTSLTQGAGVTLTPNPINGSGTIAIDPASSSLTGNFFKQGGNAFGATAVLATTDNQALELRANGARVMRYEPNAISPNVIGGSPANSVTAGLRGATIAGGGIPAGVTDPDVGVVGGPNRVTEAYGTIVGGFNNTAGHPLGSSANGAVSFVGGGSNNTASGFYSTVAGGFNNVAGGYYSFVGGGGGNIASGKYSFAAGRGAMTKIPSGVSHDGAFVWADACCAPFSPAFSSTNDNQFSVRATGGMRFVTGVDNAGTPTLGVSINPNAELSFGTTPRQMLNLWAQTYGIGVQDFAMYHRTDAHFTWYSGGTHSDSSFDPGAGGVTLMTLTAGIPAGLPTAIGTVRAQSFTAASDRNVKEAFAAVDGAKVLAALVRMPMQSWKYRNEDKAVRHIGPTAQDFHAAFSIGYDDKTIATVDADGVALAAIQGLNQKLEAELRAKDERSSQQEARILQLENALIAIQAMLRAR